MQKSRTLATQSISYVSAGQTAFQRAAIRVIEALSGRGQMIRRADGHQAEMAHGAAFWDVMMARFGLSLNVIAGGLENIPSSGPLILVANHPFGILDGLAMGSILSQRRVDFRILANSVFTQSTEIKEHILPVDFSGTKQAQLINLQTRATALANLRKGGALGVFPGGTVSTGVDSASPAIDPKWRGFAGKLVLKSGATVVPVYFHGQNSLVFQFLSRRSMTLRVAMLIREFKARVDRPIDISVGAAISSTELTKYEQNTAELMDFLRDATYALSPDARNPLDYGYEFEEKYKAYGSRRF